MMGKNLRGYTEPLTRRRVAQSSGAMVALFAKVSLEIEKFSDSLSALAKEQLERKGVPHPCLPLSGSA
jgi:hypothetical protein